jgi:putative endonuclease
MSVSKSLAGERIATGRLGENLAREHLSQGGYTIIAQNIRTPYGEIDLIAQQDDTWIFVEVKTRRTHSLGPPEISMSARKQEHLLNAVQFYCLNNIPQNAAWRIDVIAVQVLGDRMPPEILHFENAVTG